MHYSNQFDQLLNRELSSNQPSKGWLLVGDESVLIDESLKKIISQSKQNNSKNIYFTPENNFDYSFLEEASISGLFDDSNCYVFRLSSIALSKKQLQSIESFLEKDSNHLLVFLFEEFRAADKNKAMVQLFEKKALVVRHMKIKPAGYRTWVMQKLLNNQIKITNQTIDLIVHYTQGNPAAVVQLIEKIKLLDEHDSLDSKVIELLDESNLCSIFDFLDSLYHRKPDQSLKKLDALIKSGESFIKIIFLLDREIRLMIDCLSNKQTDLPSMTKPNFIFPAKKSLIERYLKYRSKQDLLSASMLIGKLDRASKGINNANVRNEVNKLVCLLTQ